MTGKRESVESRWWAKVDRRLPDECWPWIAGKDAHGYGKISDSGGAQLAHRVGYRLLVGPIPDGLDLDHMCHNDDPSCSGGRTCLHRGCVNPAHLVPATRRENSLRGHAPNILIARSPTCARGHDRAVHGYARKDRPGRFNCRECRREDRAAGRYQ